MSHPEARDYIRREDAIKALKQHELPERGDDYWMARFRGEIVGRCVLALDALEPRPAEPTPTRKIVEAALGYLYRVNDGSAEACNVWEQLHTLIGCEECTHKWAAPEPSAPLAPPQTEIADVADRLLSLGDERLTLVHCPKCDPDDYNNPAEKCCDECPRVLANRAHNIIAALVSARWALPAPSPEPPRWTREQVLEQANLLDEEADFFDRERVQDSSNAFARHLFSLRADMLRAYAALLPPAPPADRRTP